MAKKARTPAPPRKVQAPQRRVEQRRPRTAEERKTLWISIAFAASGVAAIAVVAALFFVFGRGGSSAPKAVNESQLVGLQTGPAPWNPGLDHLADRIGPLGIGSVSAEGQDIKTHIHQHLDIFVNGKKKPVPALIGIFNTAGGFIADLHTHDTTGVMHVESPSESQKFSLAEFLGVWGVRFTPTCIGGYCKPKTNWSVYVNGKRVSDPQNLVLQPHQEIAVVIGKPPPNIPSTYSFLRGE